MPFLYLPTEFELMIDRIIKEENKVESYGELEFSGPIIDEIDGQWSISREYGFNGESDDEWYEFWMYCRDFRKLYVLDLDENKQFKDKENLLKLSDGVLTKFFNNPRYFTESFYNYQCQEIGFNYDSLQNQCSFSIGEFSFLSVPDNLLNIKDKKFPFKGNEEEASELFREWVKPFLNDKVYSNLVGKVFF